MSEISRAELKYLVEHQREEIKTLNEVGKLLSATTEPQELIELTASYLHHAFPTALCSVLCLPQRQLYVIPFAPLSEMELANATRQVRERASHLFNRTITETDSVPVTLAAGPGSWIQPIAALRSHFTAPLMVKGQGLGVLSLFSGQADAFTKEDQHAVGIVAEQLGAALRNAFLLADLRRADELKNQMLSIVSHELSTPLTAIKEGVSLVLEGTLGTTTPDQRDFLSTVIENAERLGRLLQKVKTATELMTDQTHLRRESFDLRTLLTNIEKTYRPLAAARKVAVRLTDTPKPCFWPIDKIHAMQAISELVENAIQATPADGFVTIKLSTTPAEAEIQISDTGPGIANDALPTLFERFQSIGDIHERKMGGLGLGLFLAKSLITLHGGTIEVDTSPGTGTVMIVRLPKPSEEPLA